MKFMKVHVICNIKRVLLVVTGLVIVLGILQQHFFCFYGLGNSTIHYDGCVLGKYDDVLTEPLFFVSLGIFCASLFTFFISDRIFKRWITFATAWLILTTICIALTPVHVGGLLGIGPDRWFVSVWMSSLFFVISILLFVVMRVCEWKNMRTKKR